MSLVEIMAFENEGSVSFVTSVFQSENIFHQIIGARYAAHGRPRLLVHEDELEHARSLLIALGFERCVYSNQRLGLQR